jgi:hypothetical protein
LALQEARFSTVVKDLKDEKVALEVVYKFASLGHKRPEERNGNQAGVACQAPPPPPAFYTSISSPLTYSLHSTLKNKKNMIY